jgi:metal-sulfur cluster biosynthetic enzyme
MDELIAPDQRAITAALDHVIDPELGRSLLALGLVQDVEVDGHCVHVDLQLTNPRCPHAEEFIAEIKRRVGAVPGVGEVEVELCWPRV